MIARDLVPLLSADDTVALPPFGRCRPDINPVLVPIAPIEATNVVAFFPVFFRVVGATLDLVCVTGVSGAAPYIDVALTKTMAEPRFLPLLLAAYPFFIHDFGDSRNLLVLREKDVSGGPDAEPAFVDGQPTPDTERRCQALWAFHGSNRNSAELFNALASTAPFLTSSLQIEKVDESQGEILELDPRYYGSPEHAAFVERFGWDAARLVSAHRMSCARVDAGLGSFDIVPG